MLPSESSRRGFTLLEILVATAILGLILVTVYGVLSRSLYAKAHSEERAELYAAGREIVLRIADEIEGALPPTAGSGIGFIGAPGHDRVPTDAVQFVTVVRRQFSSGQNRGGRALVSYSLDPLQDRPNLFALRRQEQLLFEAAPDTTDPDNQTPAPAQSIAAYLSDQIAGLRLRYLDPNTGSWTDSWDNTQPVLPGQPLPTLPGAVEITVFVADDEGGIHDFGTIVDLPLVGLSRTPTR